MEVPIERSSAWPTFMDLRSKSTRRDFQIGQQLVLVCLWLASSATAFAAAPTVVSITPNNATISFDDGEAPINLDEEIEFTALYEDADGAGNISRVKVLVSDVVIGAQSSLVEYRRAEDKLYILNDTGDGWIGGIQPGTMGETMENNQFILDVENTSVQDTGLNTFEFKFKVRFKQGYAGSHNLYSTVSDDSPYLPWEDKGDLRVKYPGTDQVTLVGYVRDAGDSTLLPSRISIYEANTPDYYPPRGHLVLPVARILSNNPNSTEPDLMNYVKTNVSKSRQWSLDADGKFKVTLPVGKIYKIRIERGLEYERLEEDLGPYNTPDDLISRDFFLNQAVDMETEGWMSGDSHIHNLLPDAARWQADIEDLDYSNLMIMGDNSHYVTGNHFVAGPVESNSRISYVSEEPRDHQFGHITTLNLKNRITPLFYLGDARPPQTVDHPHEPTPWEIYDDVSVVGGLVYHAHADYWPGHGIGLTAVNDKIDGHEWISPDMDKRKSHVDIPHDHHHDEGTQYNGSDVYYMMLNSGLKVPLIGGTDKLGNYTPVGGTCRTYAEVDQWNHDGFISALDAGRTFITNGPLISAFTVNGSRMGEEIFSSVALVVDVDISYASTVPFDHLEIVVNGEVVETIAVSAPYEDDITRSVSIDKSSWIAVRARSDAENYDSVWYNAIYGSRASAHTSPVYVTMLDAMGDPISVAKSFNDAQFMVDYVGGTIDWIDELVVPDNFATQLQKEEGQELAKITETYFLDAIDRAFVSNGPGTAKITFTTAVNGTIVPETDPAHVYQGSLSLKHEATDDDSYSFPYYGTQVATVDTAKQYGFRFSAAAKASATTSIQLFVVCEDMNGVRTFFNESFTASIDWEVHELIGYCPALTKYVNVRIDNNDDQHIVYWDGLQLVLEENEIADGGFEGGTTSPFNGASNGILSVVSAPQHVYQGTYSLQHEATGDDSYTSPYYGVQVATVDTSEMVSFRFSAVAKGGANSSIELFVICDPAVGDDKYISKRFDATTAWDDYELTGTCPLGTKYVRIRVDNNNDTDFVYWDNLVLSLLQ